jgi:hypothetical protein
MALPIENEISTNLGMSSRAFPRPPAIISSTNLIENHDPRVQEAVQRVVDDYVERVTRDKAACKNVLPFQHGNTTPARRDDPEQTPIHETISTI